jgi:hypothetical protein
MGKSFRAYNLEQQSLLPPNMRQWLPLEGYESGDGGGQPPHHPVMMVTLLLYAYCTGKVSSRRVERATDEDVAYRVLAADRHPDLDSIAAFRQRHLPALARLFVQVLQMCEAAGLLKLGQVALDRQKHRAAMRTPGGQAVYPWHRAIAEPVFGQIKEVRGFRRFSFRGLKKVVAEWELIALTHNLLELRRAQGCPLGR